MRSLRNFLYFCLGIAIVSVLMMPSARAQSPANAVIDPAFNRILNGIVSNTPGVVTQSIPSGVSTVGTGTSTVTTASGLRIPIPETATASVSKAAIAQAGQKIFTKAIPLVGEAFMAWDIYKENYNTGLEPCSDHVGYFCKPNTSGLYPVVHWCYSGSGGAGNPNGVNCGADKTTLCGAGKAGTSWSVQYQQCVAANGGGWGLPTQYTVCPVGFTVIAGMCSPTSTVPKVPYTEQELADAMTQKMASDPDAAKRYYDAIRADYKRLRILDGNYPLPADTPLNFPPDSPIILPADTPLDIYAPTVTTPEKTVKTRTIPLSDGTVDTEVTKEKTTVTPTKTGTTVGDTKITYPTQTTTTTTTTNNTTNQSTTVTTITNEAPQAAPPKDPVDPCEGNPDRAGCALLGTPPAAEAVPTKEVPITFTPVVFASSASCPSPVTFNAYGSREFTNQPMCDNLSKLRPVILALASVSAAIIFMGGLKL